MPHGVDLSRVALWEMSAVGMRLILRGSLQFQVDGLAQGLVLFEHLIQFKEVPAVEVVLQDDELIRDLCTLSHLQSSGEGRPEHAAHDDTADRPAFLQLSEVKLIRDEYDGPGDYCRIEPEQEAPDGCHCGEQVHVDFTARFLLGIQALALHSRDA